MQVHRADVVIRTRMNGGLKSCKSIILQHMKKSGLSGVIKTKEQKLGMLVHEPKGRQDIENYNC